MAAIAGIRKFLFGIKTFPGTTRKFLFATRKFLFATRKFLYGLGMFVHAIIFALGYSSGSGGVLFVLIALVIGQYGG